MINKRILSLLVLTGIMAGLVGIGFTNLMHFIQHLTYNYTEADHLSFGLGVANASPEHRVIALLLCGVVGGVGWYVIHRFGSPLVDVKQAVTNPDKPMPTLTTLCHATLQIITVGMGSPLGREVAPREASSALITWVMKFVKVTKEERSLLIACASGAGLAAVYNSPLSATIFVLETLLLTWNRKSLISALIACGVATYIVRLGLGDTIQYDMMQPPLTGAMAAFSIVLGLVIGLAVVLFDKSQTALPTINRKSPKMIFWFILAFTFVGVMAMYFPSILGNGKAGNQLTFAELVSWQYALGMFGTKWIAVVLALAVGAYGGKITPSMMLGSTLALALGVAWTAIIGPISLGAGAFLGAVVFLGLAQKMPLTSAVFMLELSRFSVEYLFPVTLAMGVGLLVQQWLISRD
ncbi:chloride channel protein [uncultured Veillonella sp.]|uniref:chloride channel protein n=1 Tax=uncultured Veillonella sp. TaxID=159268 RepID=UPI00263177EA|nr:chloride channel protein [uncultured Veillonella sp.]